MSLQRQLSWSLMFDLIGLHNSYKLLRIDHLTAPGTGHTKLNPYNVRYLLRRQEL